MGEVEIPVGVRRADDPVVLPGNHEEHALLGPQDEAGVAMNSVSRDDKMDSLRSANVDPTSTGMFLYGIRPDACSIDDLTSFDLKRCTGF